MDTDAFNNAVDRAKLEIIADIAAGRVPSSVRTFSELHDHVDANEYGGLCDPDAYGKFDTGFANAVQSAVDTWLAGGGHKNTTTRVLVAKFDVTGLNEYEVNRLWGEIAAQAESSDADEYDAGHPDVAVDITVDPPFPPKPREVLVHLNVEVPATDTRSADEIANAVMGALEVGQDDDSVRDLKIVCPLADEV
jgi:hypothetical protein